MNIKIDDIVKIPNVLLAIEKTLYSSQNIELKNFLELSKYRFLIDTIENVKTKKYAVMLDQLIQEVTIRIKSILDPDSNYTINLREYLKPKNINLHERPIQSKCDYRILQVHTDMIDEIALNAITLSFTYPLRMLIPNQYFGNILDEYESTEFFKPYFNQYKLFAQRRFEYINSNEFNYLSVFDIKKYYDRINFDELKKVIYSHYSFDDPITSRIVAVYQTLSKNGLPQGPIFSHFFSNLLIWDMAKTFEIKFPTYKLIMYVDDINVFFNGASSNIANSINSELFIFFTEYLSTKLLCDNNNVLNEEKHQMIYLNKENKLSAILMQISAFDELRKSDSDSLDAFQRSSLKENLDHLYKELIEIISESSKNYNGSEFGDINRKEISNIVEKTNRFKTYRDILLVNNLNELTNLLDALVENDRKRCQEGISIVENQQKGGMFDKSFENYVRAVISVCHSLKLNINTIRSVLNSHVIRKIDGVFRGIERTQEFLITYRQIVNHLISEYKEYVNRATRITGKTSVSPYLGRYSVSNLYETILAGKNILNKNNISSSLDSIENAPYVNGYFEYKSDSLSFISTRKQHLFRDTHLSSSLFSIMGNLFGYSGNVKTIIPYDKNMKLLKVHEYRILNMLASSGSRMELILDKILDILAENMKNDENELCDPLINGVISFASKKIKDRLMLDSIIYAHHYVRDLWKNGARDLPFYTLHNQEHSVELISILERANISLNGILTNYLNVFELYTLLMSVYFHDLGMLYFDYSNLREINGHSISRDYEVSELNFITNEMRDFLVRFNRSERIEKLIRLYKNHRDYRSISTRKDHHYNSTRFEEINEIVVYHLGPFVKNICFNHGVDYSSMRLTDEYINKERIDAYKVTTYLRFLDGLDNCKNRVTKGLYNMISKYVSDDDIDSNTLSHWAKHMIIDSIDFCPEPIHKIKPLSSAIGTYLPSKAYTIRLIFNENIDLSMQTSKTNKTGRCGVTTNPDEELGYIYLKDTYIIKTIFESFINDYFYWTLNSVVELSGLITPAYNVGLVFGYKLQGKRSMNYSKAIYSFLK